MRPERRRRWSQLFGLFPHPSSEGEGHTGQKYVHAPTLATRRNHAVLGMLCCIYASRGKGLWDSEAASGGASEDLSTTDDLFCS